VFGEHIDLSVHGGIRHLENKTRFTLIKYIVHGGIRHLENIEKSVFLSVNVHGGIRHLEIKSA